MLCPIPSSTSLRIILGAMSSPKEMSVHEMAERFYDLFFEGSEKLTLREYLDHSFCDEVGIIDFSTDNINIAYHVNGKYFSPVNDGTFHTLFNYILETIWVHFHYGRWSYIMEKCQTDFDCYFYHGSRVRLLF